MQIGDNIFTLIRNHEKIEKYAFKNVKAHFFMLGAIAEFEHKKGFVIFVQPGAKAPVGAFLKQWMDANLGGCTDEICAIGGNKVDFGQVVLNTMTPEEQESANKAVFDAKKVDVSGLSIVNDPERVLVDFLAIDAAEVKTVETRTAYMPQAWVFDAEGNLTDIIKNNPKVNGAARESADYLKEVNAAVERNKAEAEMHQDKKVKVSV